MSYFFSSLALIVSVVSFLYLKSYIKKRTAIDRIPSETQDAVQQIINEIDRITDRDSLLIEDRIKKLKDILEDADRRIGVLSREAQSKQRVETVYAELGKKKKYGIDINAEEKKPKVENNISKKEQAILMSNSGLSASHIASKLGMAVTEVEMAIFMKNNGVNE